MKRFMVLAPLLGLCGCMADVLMTTAVTGELQAKQLAAGKKQIEQAQALAADVQITQAIRQYQAEKGANPPSLDALVPQYLPSVPAKPDGSLYGYDPATATLLEAPKPGVLTPEDWALLDKTRAAVAQFGVDTTWYPATLADLVPKYLPALPLTSDGRSFVYDNQTGQVLPPADPAAVAPRAAAPVTAAPMSEAGASIGIQQQLNNMGQSGVNAAGSRGRQNINNIGGAHTDRQMKAADELGL